ncbi:Oidioi.mRNA.OKI2018_I69.chr2.g4794.t1.cds [Oikopleura dioica]|uniref:Oidioi.mRNA.OKI2018_I69.chr2.g4794.t1.cds n=1 Tax=Oikopleura dioica TaxID=34765 RepID=A0ABN7T7I9_OIKDI|nr:Oidioi.mRNA.OKI2018_I69.chr2.g4794.t1.cds [Oikopleura dioica]
MRLFPTFYSHHKINNRTTAGKRGRENEVLEQRLNNFILEEHQHERKQQKTMKKYIRRLVENRQSTRQIKQQNKFISREVRKNSKFRMNRQQKKSSPQASDSGENTP